jgi:DNA-binding response OmpR family regulator
VKKILVLKDIKADADKKGGIITRASFRIITANSNKEILEMHKQENFDLIITKLKSPGLDGDDLCSLIRKDEKLCKVSLIILCDNNKPDVGRSSDCRANAVLTMPLSPDVLSNLVFNLLNITRRESYRVLINVLVNGKHDNKSFLCSSVNISCSGLLIETGKKLDLGDNVSCSFFLPGVKKITVNGTILRANTKTADINEYGIKFDHINLENKTSIEAFIQSKSRLEV